MSSGSGMSSTVRRVSFPAPSSFLLATFASFASYVVHSYRSARPFVSTHGADDIELPKDLGLLFSNSGLCARYCSAVGHGLWRFIRRVHRLLVCMCVRAFGRNFTLHILSAHVTLRPHAAPALPRVAHSASLYYVQQTVLNRAQFWTRRLPRRSSCHSSQVPTAHPKVTRKKSQSASFHSLHSFPPALTPANHSFNT
ncbi:hypothetical protein B0H16DRAFT_1728212 [Mycena metata]|uniref:Uncharacterized protein n=1 Tax=Mycena metata TaxID=1033252 RepID=A0AAD7II94_9AGAR|nr:hypothetical protein B0H16DRAFT_1728212 [Mycena metata]